MRLDFNNVIKGAVAILVWTFIVFIPSLRNDFIFLDDYQFSVGSQYTHDLSRNFTWKKVEKLFLNNNYDESIFLLPILSFVVEYHFFKSNPWIYHIDNLALHLINALFVYILIYSISERLDIAFLTALLFSINPLRVESVAWIAERKDLLYAFFYLWSLIMYVRAIKGNTLKVKYFISSCVLFVLSLLSKPQAITLPLVLLAIDLLYGRLHRIGVFIEKAPYLIIAAIFYLFFFHPHMHFLNLINPAAVSFIEKIFFSCDALLIYILKSLIPFKLSCLNSFPHKVNGHFFWMVYGAPMMVIGMGCLLYKLFKGERFIIFGLLFFILNIVMPLQLIWYNWFVVEHYMYLPSIGLFFACSYLIISFLERRRSKIAKAWKFVLFFYILGLSVITNQYCHVWKDDLTLWSYTIKENPNALRTSFAYLYLGAGNERRGNYKEALNDYGKALVIYPDFIEAHLRRAQVYYYRGEYAQSWQDVHKVQALGGSVDLEFLERLRRYSGKTENIEEAARASHFEVPDQKKQI